MANDNGYDDGYNRGNLELMSWSCCNDEQTLFLLLYLAYVVLAILTWNTLLSKPIRLIAVFIHEWCHAVACWLTCGDVRGIKVYKNEGGVTTFAGGCRCLIIPAGYVGCSFWSMLFVIFSGGRITALIGCITFTCSLLVTLCYSPNKTLVYICLGYTFFNILVAMLDFFWYPPLLQFLVLYYGVTIGMFSVVDIHADTVIREHKGSDAYACSQEVWSCCSSQCIGLQWVILACFFQLVGIWFALVAMSQECQDISWVACMDPSGDGFNFLDIFGGERQLDWEGWFKQASETLQWNPGR
ncbi:peptidase M50B family protein [Nitzschia inconspicua]|uniref:Peptidase M50B family protein n=1 Tax=Nitzschia inconspicua TaxID=303405 RepID=A0A9K3PPG1_9STRA|nr:peptidase M50B family protein [Nitzschia inconspicua]